jgi:hypothetical protein
MISVIEEVRKEIKKFLEFNEIKTTIYQNQWDTQGSPKGKVDSQEFVC